MRGRIGRNIGIGAIAFVALLIAGCSTPLVPKPEGYPRFDFPKKAYRLLDTVLPYTFELPTYARLELREAPNEANIVIPRFNATIYLTYYDRASALDTLFEDAHTMAYKHTIRADAIEETQFIDEEQRVFSILYEIKGDVASSVQFYATDSTSRFIRGSLYFYCPPNIDSLAPAVRFFRADILHMIETLRWGKEVKCQK